MSMLSILGNVGRDVEVRQIQSGNFVATIALAYSYGVKDPQTGKKPTQWVECSLWNKQAEALAPYLTKGTRIKVDLKDVHVEQYTKNDGGFGVKLVGAVVQLEFAGGGNNEQHQSPVLRPQYQPQPAQYQPPVHQMPVIENDDIPF